MTDAAHALAGQGWLQIGELLLAFALSSLIGLERELRGRPAGLRTQAIVGTAAALFLLISKYGFSDVLGPHVVLDPSRVAAQIVTGIGFLGAGLILTRRGAVRGLTTAASVWEVAAIGMAAGAGLWLLALVVTALHFVITYGLRLVSNQLAKRRGSEVRIEVVYADGQGLLRGILSSITSAGWSVHRVRSHDSPDGLATVSLDLGNSTDPGAMVSTLAGIDGVREVNILREEERE
jgi:putative Mg2+ transporter-C (MgtC) family protein